jgi:phosphoglycolate phosphatase
MQYAIAGIGLPARTDEQIRELIGLGLTDALSRLYPEIEPKHAMSLLEQYRRHFLSPPVAGSTLFPGVVEVLDQLRASGFRLAVATGKSRRGLDRALLETGLDSRIMVSRCADECASKPDPQMIEEILCETDVLASRALMIGDTEYDMAMARSAGVPGVGVACGVHESERLRISGASTVLADVRELLPWLKLPGLNSQASGP